ncbi:MAG: type III-A CRISPR-associated protein Csm2 [Deferribacterales bacterium]|nr:type III-A CRISPR-associated protein Csm2 [Deferribacterales bacterium]
MIEIARQKGESFNSIKTNQIRNFFAAVLSIKNKVQAMESFEFNEIKTDVLLLKPKVAYAAGRNNAVKNFKIFIDDLVDALLESSDKKKATSNFLNIIESVVAYHKFYCESDNK